MAESNLTFAKIVANPSAYSWSQVYSAGKLFAVLSLEAKEEREEKDYLNVLGKEILDTLEQEFFTLETKDLESIKQAVTATSSKIPQEINCSFVITVIIENILYIYILGNGKVSLRRDSKLGILLEASDQKTDSLKVSSGFLQQNDTIILQTKQFSDVISVDTLSEFLDNLTPAEASENLAPLVHEKEDGGAASIIINYSQARKEAPEEFAEKTFEESQNPEIEEKLQEESKNETPFYQSSLEKTKKTSFSLSFLPIISVFKNRIKLPKNFEINHSRKIILTIIIVIIVVFMGSIMFALNKQKDTKTQIEFNSIYPQALKKYQEGQGLIDLNKNLANDSFNQAKQILEGGKDKLPKTSNEEKQVLDLLSKVNNALGGGVTTTQTVSKTNAVDLSKSPLLLLETTENGLYYSEDSKNLYSITANSVFSFDKEGGSKKEIVKNNSDWQTAGGLSNYFGNVYVLDKKQNQILKYVSLDTGLTKTNYFGADIIPDFSKAVSMAIDSSVYVLSSDGTIAKFTKGKADTFSINGLSKPLSNPTAIVTNGDDANVYVLDNGNSRIVVFDKSGNYKTEYGAPIIKNAKDFEVLESDKIAYILSGEKLYQVDLK
jgi:hypothetical protein